jgi:hypothetical protein
MSRFRVSDLMINVAGPVGGGGGGCNLITECGGVTELCVENTQGCAFTQNCNCTIHTACGDEFTCMCSICTPCSQRTCGCTCTACSACTQCTVITPCGQLSHCTVRTFCTPASACGFTIRCTPTFVANVPGGLQPEHLSRLKDELRATLEQVEAEEERQKERMQPQTLDEVDLLEQKMTEALEELRRRREELERQEQGEGE